MKQPLPTADSIKQMLSEQSEIETCVRESFTALEQLHRELSNWQLELTRREAGLEIKQQSLDIKQQTDQAGQGQAQQLAEQLSAARDELRQMEEESAEQLAALETVERQHAILQAELRVERKRAQELVILLDSERSRSTEEHRLWSGEMRTMKQLIERQTNLIEELAPPESPATLNVVDVENEHAAEQAEIAGEQRSAELRRRALSRRANSKLRQQRDYG